MKDDETKQCTKEFFGILYIEQKKKYEKTYWRGKGIKIGIK